jgi:hypothetical protein
MGTRYRTRLWMIAGKQLATLAEWSETKVVDLRF